MISRSLLRRRPIAILQFAFLGILLLFLAPEILEAGGHSHGGKRRGGGFGGGIGIGIGIRLLPRIPKPGAGGRLDRLEREFERDWDQMEAEFEDEWEQPQQQSQQQPQQKRKVAAQKQAPVLPGKMSKPTVRYVSQLAMAIDPTLVTLALTDPGLAVNFFQDVADNARKRGDWYAEKEALTSLGHIYFLIGWLSKSLEQYTLVIAINKRLGDAQGLAVTLRNLSAALTAWGDFKKAKAYGDESLQLFSDTGDTVGKQMVLNNLAVIASSRGRFKRAVELFGAASQTSEEDRDSRILTFVNSGDLYTSWRVYARALEDYEKAFNEAIEMGDLRKAADILMKISQVYREQGEYANALEQSQTALGLLTRIGVPTDRVKKWIGDLYLDMGAIAEAEPYVKEAGYYSSLGRMYLMTSQLNPARQQYEKLLKESTQARNLEGQFTANTGLGSVFERSKNYRQARKYYTNALAIVDQIRSTLLPSQRKNFSAVEVNGFLRSEPARGLMRIALKQNRGTQSIDPAEMARAQDFADKLAQTPDVYRFDVPQDVLEREAHLNNKIASLRTALPMLSKQEDSKRFQAIEKEIKQAESTRDKLVRKLRTTYPNYASVKYPKPVSLKTARIAPNEYVVLFDVLGDGIGIRLIKGRRVVKSAYTEWMVTELEQEVNAFRSSFENVQLKKFDPALATKLYDRLLSDVLKDVPQGAPLTIIPDGVLALLPFDALVTGGAATWKSGEWGDYPTGLTYVGDRNPIVYYQSLTAMTLTRARAEKEQKGTRLLVMADPVFSMLDARAQNNGAFSKVAAAGGKPSLNLMAAIEEATGGLFKLPRLKETDVLAKSLKDLYGADSDIFTGLKSSKATFMSAVAPHLTRYRSIVFATHGFAGNSIPGIMEPALALTMVPPGTDGFLTMSEVAGLKMNPDIAALTACKTGVGVRLAGEGVMSMGRAFQSAGAKSVAMSLWSVSEKASVMLMEAFFKKLKDGRTKLDAWTAARQELRQAGLEHPFFWAAFMLVGERQ